jgi:hypothetical protein
VCVVNIYMQQLRCGSTLILPLLFYGTAREPTTEKGGGGLSYPLPRHRHTAWPGETWSSIAAAGTSPPPCASHVGTLLAKHPGGTAYSRRAARGVADARRMTTLHSSAVEVRSQGGGPRFGGGGAPPNGVGRLPWPRRRSLRWWWRPMRR